MISTPTEEKKIEENETITFNIPSQIEKTPDGNITQGGKVIEENEMKMLNEITNLYNEINKNIINMNNLQYSINSLAMYNNRQNYNYLNNLLCPEKAKGCKIPSSVPIPSCSFQLHNCVTLTTNNLGNIGIIFNPFFYVTQM